MAIHGSRYDKSFSMIPPASAPNSTVRPRYPSSWLCRSISSSINCGLCALDPNVPFSYTIPHLAKCTTYALVTIENRVSFNPRNIAPRSPLPYPQGDFFTLCHYLLEMKAHAICAKTQHHAAQARSVRSEEHTSE